MSAGPYGFVYLLQNVVDGKAYIGATRTTPAVRLKNHRGSARRLLRGGAPRDQVQLITEAMALHGVEAFSIKGVWPAATSQSLDELERTKIHEHSTLAPKGYNLELGGRSGSGRAPHVSIVISEMLKRSEPARAARLRWHMRAAERASAGVFATSNSIVGKRLMNRVQAAKVNVSLPLAIKGWACKEFRAFCLERLGVPRRYQSVSREERCRRQSAAQTGRHHPHRGVVNEIRDASTPRG